MRLLLVEDSARLTELLSERVHEIGWRIDAVATMADARAAVALEEHALLLIDLGLPDGDGLSLIREIRRSGSKVPVLVLTARGAIEDRIAGLDAGADDYLTKPFHHAEFLARARALLRRSPLSHQPTIKAGRLRYEVATMTLRAGEAELRITQRERALLEMLMRDQGRVVRKRRLEHGLSEYGEEFSTNALELTLSRLRRKLGRFDTGVVIETVRGVGYMLRETEE